MRQLCERSVSFLFGTLCAQSGQRRWIAVIEVVLGVN